MVASTENPGIINRQPHLKLIVEDPMGYVDGANTYEFVHDDPIDKVDPLGLDTTQPAPPTTQPQYFKGKSLGNFTLTVYNIALESDYGGKKTEQPKHLSRCYSHEFLKGIEMQGTGKDTDGKYIRWDKGKGYTYTKGVITASGRLAVSGVTIAVDPRVIPLGSLVYIEGLGILRADDTGGAIKGNHIDLYYEVSRKDARDWGTKEAEVFEVTTNAPSPPTTQPTP